MSQRAPVPFTHTVDNTNTLSPIRFSTKPTIFLKNWLIPGSINFSAFCSFVKALICLTWLGVNTCSCTCILLEVQLLMISDNLKLSNSLLWSNSDREFNPVGEKKRKIEKKLQYTAWKKRKTCSQVALPWQRKGKRSVSKKDNFGHFLCQMLSTFRLFIGWRDDSCSQTNVGKELLRNFSFWALGPRTIWARNMAQTLKVKWMIFRVHMVLWMLHKAETDWTMPPM